MSLRKLCFVGCVYIKSCVLLVSYLLCFGCVRGLLVFWGNVGGGVDARLHFSELPYFTC